VPYTRGGERSRDPQTILSEVQELIANGYKEVTLLGQNVDSFLWEKEDKTHINFAQLLAWVAQLNPQLRVRFSTSHPKDITEDVLLVIAKYPNICRSIHLPAQSGSSRILELMKRGYSREWYLGRIEAIRRIIPGCTITTDIITGFCGETEEDHQQTLSLIQAVGFEFAFMFKYSARPKTYAERKYTDDVPEETKSRRLQEIIDLQNQISKQTKKEELGKIFEVLVEGVSKKSKHELFGRTSQNNIVVFPSETHKIGDYVLVKIEKCTSATLIGCIV
jgi:tRNA-2-methylthio-N6-dimethylallyladenosine synthase